MWINLEEEEFEVISDVLKHCNLYGLHFLIKQRLAELSPVNPKHTKLGAVKAAQTYFSASDVIIEEDFVKWLPNGDALVMAWQVVPSVYIDSEDCVPCKQKQSV
jgi:hypothetical protein